MSANHVPDPDESFLSYARASFMRRFRNQEPRWSPLTWGRIGEVIRGDLAEACRRWDAFEASTEDFHVKRRLNLKWFLDQYDTFVDGPIHDRKPPKPAPMPPGAEAAENARLLEEAQRAWL